MMMVIMVEVENMYARSKQGISDLYLVVYFVVLDGFLRLLLTWLISSRSQEFATSASTLADLSIPVAAWSQYFKHNY